MNATKIQELLEQTVPAERLQLAARLIAEYLAAEEEADADRPTLDLGGGVDEIVEYVRAKRA